MVLHWLIAFLLIALVMVGLYIAGLPDVGFDTRRIRLILYHKELGILALTLVAPPDEGHFLLKARRSNRRDVARGGLVQFIPEAR
jgi:hypothetical protein